MSSCQKIDCLYMWYSRFNIKKIIKNIILLLLKLKKFKFFFFFLPPYPILPLAANSSSCRLNPTKPRPDSTIRGWIQREMTENDLKEGQISLKQVVETGLFLANMAFFNAVFSHLTPDPA